MEQPYTDTQVHAQADSKNDPSRAQVANDPRSPGRLAALVQAAKVLAASGRPEETLDRLVRLAVAAYGDFCVIVVPHDHQLHMVTSAHADPAKDVFARLLRGPVPAAPGGGSPATLAFQQGQPVVAGDLDSTKILGWFGDPRYAGFAEGIGLRTVAAIPLESRDSVVGVMTLGYSEDPAEPAAEVEAARPFADLVAVAVQQLLDDTRRAELSQAFGPRWSRSHSGGTDAAHHEAQVLLVDSLGVVREGLKLLLTSSRKVSVCAEASSLAAATQNDCEPDLIVTELLLGDESGPQVVAKLTRRFPNARVVVLSRATSPIYVHLALAAGARGYLSKDASTGEVTDAIEAIAGGEEYLQPALGTALARWQHMREDKKLHGFDLTPREHEVLRLVATGHTNSEIATMLGVSLRTVETHRSHLARKLGTRSRAELVEAEQQLHPGSIS